MQDYYNRFDLIFDDTAEEYMEKKEKKSIELEKKRKIKRQAIEDKGLCIGCGVKDRCRWVFDDDIYLCYECYIDCLRNEAAEGHPRTGASYLDDYMEEDDWNERWEDNE